MKTRYQVPHTACGFSAVLLIAFLTVFTWAHTARCAESDAPKTETKSSTKEKPAPAATPKDQQAAAPGKKGEKKMEKNPIVVMETSMGPVEIELFADKAPVSVQNFLKYADEGFYNGTVFHRVIPDFMIQGGGFTEDLKQKPTHAPIKNEATNGLKNERGTLAMARTMVVDSATAQFFINVKDNPFLNHTAPNERGYGYAVFGKVLSGMDVVDKIKGMPTTTKGMYENVPVSPVTIKSVKRK